MSDEPLRLIAVSQHASCAKCKKFPCAVFMVKGHGYCAGCTKKKLKGDVELFVEPKAVDEVLRWNATREDEK